MDSSLAARSVSLTADVLLGFRANLLRIAASFPVWHSAGRMHCTVSSLHQVRGAIQAC
jgi:hypothetical protein